MPEVFIGIGSNIGQKKSNIQQAVHELSLLLDGVKCSSYYSTEPRDYFEQDSFENVVVSGTTTLSPEDLLHQTQRIEKEGGRSRHKAIPKGPRTIDLDILLYEDVKIKSEYLIIPHPSIKDRLFVLLPLVELSPLVKDPVTDQFYFESIQKNTGQGVYCSTLSDYNNCFV